MALGWAYGSKTAVRREVRARRLSLSLRSSAGSCLTSKAPKFGHGLPLQTCTLPPSLYDPVPYFCTHSPASNAHFSSLVYSSLVPPQGPHTSMPVPSRQPATSPSHQKPRDLVFLVITWCRSSTHFYGLISRY